MPIFPIPPWISKIGIGEKLGWLPIQIYKINHDIYNAIYQFKYWPFLSKADEKNSPLSKAKEQFWGVATRRSNKCMCVCADMVYDWHT